MTQKLLPNAPCLCGSGLKYKKCCRPFHQGKLPDTPEQLMRSRYTAYALGRVAYILETTHPDSPHRRPDADRWRFELDAFCRNTDFQKLEVMSTSIDEKEGWVTFHATLQQGKQDVSFTEKSLFKQINGRWFYLTAVD